MIKILLADDNPIVLSSLRLMLETRLDVEIIREARDMAHVIAQVEDSHPDCVILDWNLPGRPMRGRIPVLKALGENIHIIVVNTRPELEKEILAEGADEFVCRTDPPEKLLDAIHRISTKN